MSAIHDVGRTLLSLRTNQETTKILQTTCSLLRCFLFFDICYLIAGLTLVTLALTNQIADKDRMILVGGFFSLFASISAMCNSLANHGVRTWRRCFLMPWLIFWLVVLAFLSLNFANSLYLMQFHIEWRLIFLFFATYAVFSCWRHMQKQYLAMSLPRPEQVVVDIESVVREYLRPSTAVTPPGDLPPKYEEVGDELPPPMYDEKTMKVSFDEKEKNEHHPEVKASNEASNKEDK